MKIYCQKISGLFEPKNFFFHFSTQVGYDRRIRPNYGGPPVSVKVSLYVLSVGEISYKFMDFTFDMYFRLFQIKSRVYQWRQFFNESQKFCLFVKQIETHMIVLYRETCNVLWKVDNRKFSPLDPSICDI